jgi:hypothetical protein
MDNLETLEELQNIINGENSLDTGESIEKISLQAPKKKKILSDKQLKVLEDAREKMREKAKENKIKKQLEEAELEKEVQRRLNEYKKSLEDRIVKKAISIKKKEIKKSAILDDISDDETPMEEIKKIAKKQIPLQKQPIQIQKDPQNFPGPVPDITKEQKPKYIYV